MARGLHWGFGANGDPYSMLISGRDDDPWQCYRMLRATGTKPFASRAGAWVVSDYPTVAHVLKEPSFAHGPARIPVWMRVAGCPADSWAGAFREFHSRWTKWEGWEGETVDTEWLEAQCAQLLSSSGTKFDLVRNFAREVPLLALSRMQGLEKVEADRLRVWAEATRVTLDAQLSPQELIVTERALATLDEIDAVTGSQEAAILIGEVAESAANLVANAVLAVLDRPDLAARLTDDPGSAKHMVAEVTRTSPPVHLERRTAEKDCMLAGVEIAKDSEVIVVLAAANRDPSIFTDPDRFDVDRTGSGEILSSRHGRSNRYLDEVVVALGIVALRAVAPILPRLSRSGPVIRRRRSPVAHGLSRCAVELR